MLSKYAHDTPVHIGAITEIEPQVCYLPTPVMMRCGILLLSVSQRLQWGFLAYGGAGMALSSGLVGKMNEEGRFEKCLVDHHDKFGGAPHVDSSLPVQAAKAHFGLDLISFRRRNDNPLRRRCNEHDSRRVSHPRTFAPPTRHPRE